MTDAAADERTLLLVDDDAAFRQRLAVMLERRGFQVTAAEGVAAACKLAAQLRPAYAVVDMRLEDGNGLDVVAELRQVREDVRAVILTGYGNLATAVAAVKTGAVDYLAKPAEPEDIIRALLAEEGERPEPPEEPMSADRVRWEHIQRVYELCGRNVSETARRLKMHRRTLQRILAKRSPK
ncbi:ActR/PrrA/RegA family redox response regulator transcription factor [Parapedomonas caeni]|jgi:two-component system response regulator RegA